MKSFLLRGGIVTILLANSIVLLGLAGILQLIFGGFVVTAARRNRRTEKDAQQPLTAATAPIILGD